MSIPLTRLGGRAFNADDHGDDTEREYDRLRDLARSEAEKRNACFDKSRQAYSAGDGARAKELSNEGKSHDARMDDYNRQASDYIFRANNAPGRVDADAIDLHGQFVEEAERILEERIRADRARGQTHLHAIVGKGNHSAGHVQKIKPKVEELCREMGLQCRTEENAGRIYINLQGGEPLPPQHGASDAVNAQVFRSRRVLRGTSLGSISRHLNTRPAAARYRPPGIGLASASSALTSSGTFASVKPTTSQTSTTTTSTTTSMPSISHAVERTCPNTNIALYTSLTSTNGRHTTTASTMRCSPCAT
ncbi:Smr domain-containing protein [Beauveria bassiana]|nr:Smr domain-containing protein [Beauveria bassiana]